MLKQTPKDFREFFMIEFTKELIRSTEKYKEFFIQQEIKEVIRRKNLEKQIRLRRENKIKKTFNKTVRDKLKRDSQKIKDLGREESLPEFKKKTTLKTSWPKEFIQKVSGRGRSSSPLRIPEIRLPETVKDITPVFSSREIDLEKLNTLIKDPLVREIECNGPNEKVIVRGGMGRKSTGILLSEEEIDNIIGRFAEAAKIPVSTGIYKVVYGRLILSAIISEVISPKFIIKKMSEPLMKVPLGK